MLRCRGLKPRKKTDLLRHRRTRGRGAATAASVHVLLDSTCVLVALPLSTRWCPVFVQAPRIRFPPCGLDSTPRALRLCAPFLRCRAPAAHMPLQVFLCPVALVGRVCRARATPADTSTGASPRVHLAAAAAVPAKKRACTMERRRQEQRRKAARRRGYEGERGSRGSSLSACGCLCACVCFCVCVWVPRCMPLSFSPQFSVESGIRTKKRKRKRKSRMASVRQRWSCTLERKREGANHGAV